MENKTTAQTIADRFNNDGQRFTSNDGYSLVSILSTYIYSLEKMEHGTSFYAKYIFNDDSSIIIYNGSCWDIGINGLDNDFRSAVFNDQDLIVDCEDEEDDEDDSYFSDCEE